MVEKVGFEEGKNKYKTFSDLLSLLVDDLNKYSRDFKRTEIDRCLLMMAKLVQSMSHKIQLTFQKLKSEVDLYLAEPNNLERLMDLCVKLKNELWEL